MLKIVIIWLSDRVTKWPSDRKLRRRLTVWYIFIIYFYPLLPVKYCRQSPRQSTTSRKRIMGIFSCSWPLLQSLNRLGFPTVRKRGLLCRKSDPRVIKTIRARRAAVLPWVRGTEVKVSAANRLIGEVVQSWRRPLLKVSTTAFTFKTLCGLVSIVS